MSMFCPVLHRDMCSCLFVCACRRSIYANCSDLVEKYRSNVKRVVERSGRCPTSSHETLTIVFLRVFLVTLLTSSTVWSFSDWEKDLIFPIFKAKVECSSYLLISLSVMLRVGAKRIPCRVHAVFQLVSSDWFLIENMLFSHLHIKFTCFHNEPRTRSAQKAEESELVTRWFSVNGLLLSSFCNCCIWPRGHAQEHKARLTNAYKMLLCPKTIPPAWRM